MSLLEKLHRNDNDRAHRPEAELKKLFKGKGKSRDNEEQQHEDESAADRLAQVALGGNPIDMAARSIVGGADPIAPIGKANRTQPNVGVGSAVGVSPLGGLNASIGGFDVHVDANVSFEGKKPTADASASVHGQMNNASVDAEVSTPDLLAKKKQVEGKFGVNAQVNEQTEINAEISSPDLLAKKKQVAGKVGAHTQINDQIDIDAEISSPDLLAKKKQVNGELTGSAQVLGTGIGVGTGEVALQQQPEGGRLESAFDGLHDRDQLARQVVEGGVGSSGGRLARLAIDGAEAALDAKNAKNGKKAKKKAPSEEETEETASEEAKKTDNEQVQAKDKHEEKKADGEGKTDEHHVEGHASSGTGLDALHRGLDALTRRKHGPGLENEEHEHEHEGEHQAKNAKRVDGHGTGLDLDPTKKLAKTDDKHVDGHGMGVANDDKAATHGETDTYHVDGHGTGLDIGPNGKTDGKHVDGHGMGLLIDQDLEHGADDGIEDAEGNKVPYKPGKPAPRPQPSKGAHPGGFAKPAPKPELPPPPQTATQTAINGFIEKARADRDSAKAKTQAQQLAKSAQVSVDAQAIATQVKAKNDVKLAEIRKKAEAEKAKAAVEAKEKQAQQGPVTLESLKEKFESTATADKTKLKTEFDAKKSELTARLATQKETLQGETAKQINNLKTQQETNKKAAEASWTTQKAGLEKARDNLQAEVRKNVAADQTRLEKDKEKLWKAADVKLAKIDNDTKTNAAKVRTDGESKAAGLENKANGDARGERARGQAEAAAARNAGGDGAESKASNAINAAATRVANLETKGRLNGKAVRAETETQAKKVEDTGKRAHDDLKKVTSNQVNAIEEKIKALGPLLDQKIKQAEDELKTKLTAGETKLKDAVKGNEDQIAKLKADGDAKITKLQGEAETKLQKDYDAAVSSIDKRVEAARKQLATGNDKNLKALEKMVDSTCKAIDKTVTDTEKKFDHTIQDAEHQAQAFVLAQLHKIKAEADKALVAIDKNFDEAMKIVDAAVEAAHKKLEETTKGKVLEIEVHVGTLLNDIGDGSRLAAAKSQLEYYIKEGKPIPAGYGETASPPAPEAKKDAKPGEPTTETAKFVGDPKDAAGAKPKETDVAAEERAKLLDPKNLEPDAIEAKVQEAIKKGQKDTTVVAAESANAKVATAYTDASAAVTKLAGTKSDELEMLKAGNGKMIAEVEKAQDDEKQGKAAADELDRAMKQENRLGNKSPDKKAMLAAMRGKTPEQIEAMKAAYKAKTGRDLDADIKSEMSGDELVEAKGHLSGDPVLSAVAELRNSGGTFSGDKDKMMAVLNNPHLTSEQKQKIYDEFESQTGKSLTDFFKSELSAKDAAEMKAKLGDVKVEVFDPTKPPALEPGEKAPDPKEAEKAAAALRGAMDGIGTDEAKIFETLKGKSPSEIFAIRKAFKDHYNIDFDKALESEMSGTELAAAKAQLKADPVKAAAAALVDAADGLGTDEKRIHDTLEGIKDPEQRRKVAEEFERRTGTSIKQMLKDEMSGNDKDLAVAYAEGDTTKAAAIKLEQATHGGFLTDIADGISDTAGVDRKYMRDGMKGAMEFSAVGQVLKLKNGGEATLSFSTDSAKMYEVLASIEDPAEREKVRLMYKERTGEDLDKFIEKKMSGAEKDVCQAYLAGDTATAAAAQMKEGAESFWGTDEKSIYKQLGGKPEWQRKQIIAAYNAKYGGEGGQSFDAMLADEMSGLDLEKAKMLAKDGKVPPEFELEYAMDGIGTDEDAIKNALKGKSQKEVDAIRVAWNKRHPNGPSMDAAIKDEMPDGRDGFEVEMMLEGEPQPGEPNYEKRMLERAERKYKFDRSDALSNGVMDVFSDSGKDLDREHEKLAELKAAFDKGGMLTPEQKAQLDTHLNRQDLDQTNYVASKNAVTENLATAAGVVAGVVVSIVTAGAAAPFVVAAIAALAGGAATMAVKMAMQGGAYGIEDMGIDAAKTLLQAMTAGGMKYLGPGLDAALKAYGPVVAAMVQGALSGAIGGATNSAFDEAASRDLGDWLKNMLKGTAMGALGGAAGGLVGTVPNSGGSGAAAMQIKAPPDTFVTAALKGSYNSVIGAIGSAAVDPSMYEGKWEDIAKKWGKTVGQAAVQGIGDGITTMKEEHIAHFGQMAADAVAAKGGGPADQMAAYHDAVSTMLEAKAAKTAAGGSTEAPATTHAGGTDSHAGGTDSHATADTHQTTATTKTAEMDAHGSTATTKTAEMDAHGSAATTKTAEMDAHGSTATTKTAEMDAHGSTATTKTAEMDAHATANKAAADEAHANATNDTHGTGTKSSEEAHAKNAELAAKDPAAAAKETHEATQQAKKSTEELPLLRDQLDHVTGVEKGPAHETEMGKLREMYELQAREAEQVANVNTRRTEQMIDLDQGGARLVKPDGTPYGYQIDSKFDTRRFSYEGEGQTNLTVVTIKVYLDATGAAHNGPGSVTPATHAQLEALKADVHAGVDTHYNDPKHKMPNGDRLQVVVEFVNNPADAHMTVNARAGEGRADQTNWYVGSEPRPGETAAQAKARSEQNGTVHAHELGHQLGLIDEYHDQGTRTPAADRATPTSPQVHGDGLMSDFNRWDPTHKNPPAADGTPVPDGKWVPDPNAAALQGRHKDQIQGDINGASGSLKSLEEVRNKFESDKALERLEAKHGSPDAKDDPKVRVATEEPKTRVATEEHQVRVATEDERLHGPGSGPVETVAEGKKMALPKAADENVAAAAHEPNKPKMTPEELAKDTQRLANEDRANKASGKKAELDVIDELAMSATTKADWEYIRKLEAEAKRPLNERFSVHDNVAELEAKARQNPGSVTEEQRAAAHAEAKRKTDDHNSAVESLTGEVNQSIQKKDQEVVQRIADQVKDAPKVNGRKEITVDSAISFGMGGAGAAGAHGDLPGGHDTKQARTDRIGIQDGTKPELWGTLGHKPMGQEADALSYGTGGIKTGDIAEHGTAMAAKASEMALQVAAQRDASGVGTIDSHGPAGPLEYKKVVVNGKEMLEVGVPTRMQTGTDEHGKPIIEVVLIKTTQGVDISTGMGPARELSTHDTKDRKAQMKHADKELLQQQGKMVQGEQALAMDPNAFKGERVLGIGGGPTSVWAMEHAVHGEAAHVEVAGQMPRPKKGTALGDDLIQVEAQIRAHVDANEPVPAELTNRHHEIVTEHVLERRGRVAELDAQLAAGTLTGHPLELAQQERARIASELDPFLGSRVDRNEKMLNSDKITFAVADVIQVKPIKDAAGNNVIEVTYGDGTKRIVDRVIPSIGSNPDSPGGIHDTLKKAPLDMELIPVISFGRVVGLESNPPGITISGGAMVGTLGHNMAPEILKRIPPEMRDAVIASIVDHASRDGVSAGSKGIVPGIENVGSNTQLTIDAMNRIPPEQRSAELKAFLKKHDKNRAENFDGELRFPDAQPKSGTTGDRMKKLAELEMKASSSVDQERGEAHSDLAKLKHDPEWRDAFELKANAEKVPTNDADASKRVQDEQLVQ